MTLESLTRIPPSALEAPACRQITPQLRLALSVIESHLGESLRAIHLFGSAVASGLKPTSDVDLLVTVSGPLDEALRQALLRALLAASAPPKTDPALRALEVTVIDYDEIVPWRPPARRLLQFGEWLRDDLLAEVFEPPLSDPDLAILLTEVRQHSLALFGAPADKLFDPVPEHDRLQAFGEALALWRSPPDWTGDERNVMLTLARIWYSIVTGRIVAKDVAAEWLLARLPAKHRSVLGAARKSYLGPDDFDAGAWADEVDAFIDFARAQASALLMARQGAATTTGTGTGTRSGNGRAVE